MIELQQPHLHVESVSRDVQIGSFAQIQNRKLSGGRQELVHPSVTLGLPACMAVKIHLKFEQIEIGGHNVAVACPIQYNPYPYDTIGSYMPCINEHPRPHC